MSHKISNSFNVESQKFFFLNSSLKMRLCMATPFSMGCDLVKFSFFVAFDLFLNRRHLSYVPLRIGLNKMLHRRSGLSLFPLISFFEACSVDKILNQSDAALLGLLLCIAPSLHCLLLRLVVRRSVIWAQSIMD